MSINKKYDLRILGLFVAICTLACKKERPKLEVYSQSPFQVIEKPTNWKINGVRFDAKNSSKFWFWGQKKITDNSEGLLGLQLPSSSNNFSLFLNQESDLILHDIIVQDDQIIIAGEIQINSNEFATKDAFVGVCRKDGNIIWWDTIQGNYYDQFQSISIINDSLIALVGTTQTSYNGYKALSACFGITGEKKWVKKVEGFSLVEKGIQINQLNEQELIITQSVSAGSGGTSYLSLKSLSLNDGTITNVNIDLITQRTYQGYIQSLFHRDYKEVWNTQTNVSPEGDILIFGQKVVDGESTLFGVSLSQSGNLKWFKEYDFLYDMAYLNDVYFNDTNTLAVSYLVDDIVQNELLLIDQLGSPVKQIGLMELMTTDYCGVPLEVRPSYRGYSIIGDLKNLRSGAKDLFRLEINKNGEILQ